ncbi:hypothetical protein, partial [Streptomyces sp.]|uniref:hypothetical protein n=1 Tax=Streptomyces sp. TaxID=1931 RepID=UPI002F938E1B
MSELRAAELRQARRRLPAALLLLALLALVASICHGSHGHTLPYAAAAATPAVSAPELPHGCDERPGERWSFDAHLPAQAAAQLAAPDEDGAAPLAHTHT